MTKRIFISYRRDDSAGHAGRVFDRLKAEFGADNLFMDVDATPLGVNFVKYLGEQVGKCDVLLAIIGPAWLTVKHDDGSRRLDNPNDLVRVEIAAALARDIPVIPILLEGTRVPKSEVLPKDLQDLSQRHGLDVRHASFHADMDKLVRGLNRGAADAPREAKTGIVSAPEGHATLGTSGNRADRSVVRPKTAEEVITARGTWITEYGINPTDAIVPVLFKHFFMVADFDPDDRLHTSGAVLSGAKWNNVRVPDFELVHGFCNPIVGSARQPERLSVLTYLGPKWQPYFPSLSEKVFVKLGAKPFSHFITYPSKTPVPVKK
jgi:hypothetical protein